MIELRLEYLAQPHCAFYLSLHHLQWSFNQDETFLYYKLLKLSETMLSYLYLLGEQGTVEEAHLMVKDFNS